MGHTVKSTMSRVIFSLSKIVLLISALALSDVLQAQSSIPEHGAVWVHDEAGVLSAQAKSVIEAAL